MRPQTLGGGVYLVNVDLHAAGNSSGRPAAPSAASHGPDRRARGAGGAPVCRWLCVAPLTAAGGHTAPPPRLGPRTPLPSAQAGAGSSSRPPLSRTSRRRAALL